MSQSPRSFNPISSADDQPDVADSLPDAGHDFGPDAGSDAPGDEARMRRALGLLTGDGSGRGAKTQMQARTPAQMRAQGGRTAGPVVVEHATLTKPDRPGAAVNRLAGLEAQLLAERQARAQSERQLRDAQLALQDARTKQAHAEMARQDAEKRLAEARAELEALHAEHAAAVPAAPASPGTPPAAMAAATATGPRKRGRPPKVRPVVVEPEVPPQPLIDGEPIEWWLPGWQKKV